MEALEIPINENLPDLRKSAAQKLYFKALSQYCMLPKNYCQDLRELIQRDELENAIYRLRALLKDSPYLNEALLQAARLTDFKKQIRLGQLSYEESELGKNKIRLGLLELVEEIEEKLADPKVEEEVQQYVQSISGKNIIGGNIQAGGNIDIKLGDRIQNITESKSSRNIRRFLFVLVPLLTLTSVWLYIRFQQLQQPLMLNVTIENRTLNADLDKDFTGGEMILQYGSKSDTQRIKQEALFRGIPANYAGKQLRLRYLAKGFVPLDTNIILGPENIRLAIQRDDTYSSLQGIVNDEEGQPIANALVSTQGISTATDTLGQFTLEIPFEKQRKQQRLQVIKAGFKAWDRQEPVFKNKQVRIQLEKSPNQ